MKTGIGAKFILLVATLLIFVFSGTALYLNISGTATLRNNLTEEAKSFASLATAPIGGSFLLYGDSGTTLLQRKVDEFAELNKNIKNIAVVDIYGKVLFTQHKDTKPRVTVNQASSFERIILYGNDKSVETIIEPYFEDFGAHRYSMVYSVSNESIVRSIRQATVSVIIMSATALLVTITLIYAFVHRWLIRRIIVLSEQSLAISAGDYSQKIGIDTSDELGLLARSVNTMATKLRSDIDALKLLDKEKSEFMMITSHNLRTPLTIINGYLENVTGNESAGELNEALQRIRESSVRLNGFAEDMLAISRLELGETQIEFESYDMNKFVSLLADNFKTLAQQKKLEFSVRAPADPVYSEVNKAYIRAAIWNLLDNAYKFTPEGKSVSLSLSATESLVKIEVKDTGIGIAPQEIPKLFTKFHRGTSTLAYDFEGTGIGLYLTKLILDRHHGSIDVVSAENVGTTFTVLLPRSTVKATSSLQATQAGDGTDATQNAAPAPLQIPPPAKGSTLPGQASTKD